MIKRPTEKTLTALSKMSSTQPADKDVCRKRRVVSTRCADRLAEIIIEDNNREGEG